jgi:glycosyltransferase involved in cell wall biosynthesis
MPEARPLYVNGRFLAQPLSGMQRFAEELLGALDAQLAAGEHAALGPVTVCVPPGSHRTPAWQVLRIRQGHAWEQVQLAWAARGGTLLSLAGSGPLLHADHVLALHDANVFANPQFFTRAYGLWHRTLRPLLARRARALITVSEFSRGELARYCGVPEGKFTVIGDSAEHMLDVAPDDGVLDRLGVRGRVYALTVGNQTPNKNIGEAIEAFIACQAPDAKLVVAGGGADKVFPAVRRQSAPNVVFAGRVTDEELAALYRHARVFVFPSIYEGFGVPPLEALTLGCPVIARRASAVPEVLADSAVFYSAPAELTSALRSAIATPKPTSVGSAATRFSWNLSANRLVHLLS